MSGFCSTAKPAYFVLDAGFCWLLTLHGRSCGDVGDIVVERDFSLAGSYMSRMAFLIASLASLNWITAVAVACNVCFPSDVSSSKSTLSMAKNRNLPLTRRSGCIFRCFVLPVLGLLQQAVFLFETHVRSWRNSQTNAACQLQPCLVWLDELSVPDQQLEDSHFDVENQRRLGIYDAWRSDLYAMVFVSNCTLCSLCVDSSDDLGPIRIHRIKVSNDFNWYRVLFCKWICKFPRLLLVWCSNVMSDYPCTVKNDLHVYTGIQSGFIKVVNCCLLGFWRMHSIWLICTCRVTKLNIRDIVNKLTFHKCYKCYFHQAGTIWNWRTIVSTIIKMLIYHIWSQHVKFHLSACLQINKM